MKEFKIIFEICGRNKVKPYASRNVFRKVKAETLDEAIEKATEIIDKKYGEGYYRYCDYQEYGLYKII